MDKYFEKNQHFMAIINVTFIIFARLRVYKVSYKFL